MSACIRDRACVYACLHACVSDVRDSVADPQMLSAPFFLPYLGHQVTTAVDLRSTQFGEPTPAYPAYREMLLQQL